jgi:hypothetical protein
VIWGRDGWREENASKQELSHGSDFITTEKAQHAFEHAGPARQRSAPPWDGKFGGIILMKTIRPDTSDPIPLRTSPHGVGTITIRFVGLLIVAVVVLALAWGR